MQLENLSPSQSNSWLIAQEVSETTDAMVVSTIMLSTMPITTLLKKKTNTSTLEETDNANTRNKMELSTLRTMLTADTMMLTLSRVISHMDQFQSLSKPTRMNSCTTQEVSSLCMPAKERD